MYLFYMMNNGYIPMGNDGQLIVPRNIKSAHAISELAKSWLGKRAGTIYFMNTWTQAMCEMGPTAFNEYIRHHGKMVAHS